LTINFKFLVLAVLAWLALLAVLAVTAASIGYDAGWRDGITHAFVSDNPATEVKYQ
jgi:hypothetical protein